MEGKFALQSFLSKWCKFPADVEFLIDEMVEGDRAATAVTWHLEVAGKPVRHSTSTSIRDSHQTSISRTPALCLIITTKLQRCGAHLQMPFSRGVSFYRVDEMGLLCFGRDLVEPAVKSGGGGVVRAPNDPSLALSAH